MASKNQDRLATFFAGQASDDHPTRWDDLWKAGDFLPWDRGFPNPALFDTLLDHPATFGSSLKPDGTRKRALVPGCGKGYDLLLLSAFGYDAWGVEYSENAVKAANEFLANAEKEHREEYKVRDEKIGRGVQKCLFGDFFSDDWVKEIGDIGEGFDLIYDCTFLSALPYDLRPAWARRTVQLLAPSGHLVCLEFPTKKPPKSGGPPWALPPVVYEELLARPGEDVAYDENLVCVPSNPRRENDDALVRIAHWQPERTHDVGKGTDWVSIWKHK